jgi:hypothetical protein
VVTPRADVDPQRYDFAKLGEKIAESLVQSAQQQANAANVMLEQARQLADDIRSQVADKSRELAEMNERLMDGVALLFALAVRLFFGNVCAMHCSIRMVASSRRWGSKNSAPALIASRRGS